MYVNFGKESKSEKRAGRGVVESGGVSEFGQRIQI